MNLDSSGRKKPQRLKDRLRETTAAAILEAAQEVLVEKGLQASMEHIAARAGVAVGTLYNHFSDRRALVDSLLTTHRERMFTDIREAEAKVLELPVREQLIAMLTPMRATWSQIFLVIKQGEAMPDTKKRAEMRQRFQKLFGPALERGRKQGVIAADPKNLHALTLQGIIQSLFAFATENPKELSAEDAITNAVDLFLGGVGKRAKP